MLEQGEVLGRVVDRHDLVERTVQDQDVDPAQLLQEALVVEGFHIFDEAATVVGLLQRPTPCAQTLPHLQNPSKLLNVPQASGRGASPLDYVGSSKRAFLFPLHGSTFSLVSCHSSRPTGHAKSTAATEAERGGGFSVAHLLADTDGLSTPLFLR